MTDLERIEAAIDERPHTWFNYNQGEREGRTKEITQWFFDHEQTILEALRVYKALMGEPTTGVLKAALESKAIDDEGTFHSLGDHIGYSGENKNYTVMKAAAKAMSAELIKQVKEQK